MGLQSAFESQLHSPRPLEGFDELVWQSLAAGAGSPEHPWNLGGLTTVDPGTQQPHCRTVVLRDADRPQRTIDCHTDVRSGKGGHLLASNGPAPVCWLFYEHRTKIQLRLRGTAEIIGGEEAETAWEATSLASRSAYVSLATPGSPHAGAEPPSTADREVSLEASERGRDHFRIVRTHVAEADWLYLRSGGHLRVALRYDADGQAEATWLVP